MTVRHASRNKVACQGLGPRVDLDLDNTWHRHEALERRREDLLNMCKHCNDR